MWPKHYIDYKEDQPLIKYPVEPGQGIIGCEMHEIFGWGNTLHIHKKHRKRSLIRSLLNSIFRTPKQE